MVKLPSLFNYNINFLLCYCGPTTPERILVWAISFSLATTKEIDFSFFSSSYLDVSVHWVALIKTIYSL